MHASHAYRLLEEARMTDERRRSADQRDLDTNEAQAAEVGARLNRPYTDDGPAQQQEGDQTEHVEDLAEDLEGEVRGEMAQSPRGDRPSTSADDDSAIDRRPPGSRAPG